MYFYCEERQGFDLLALSQLLSVDSDEMAKPLK